MESEIGLTLKMKQDITEHFNLALVNTLLIFNFINFRELGGSSGIDCVFVYSYFHFLSLLPL